MAVTQDADISRIFKEEYSNLVAVLFHHYQLSDIQLAEDVVSDTFIKAMKTWSYKGIPDNPKAWLRRSAKNLFIDYVRRQKTFHEKIVPEVRSSTVSHETEVITEDIIEDSQLRMIFVVCDPRLKNTAQLCLALRILIGLNIDEIAAALFISKDHVNKTLYRAKKTLAQAPGLDQRLGEKDYERRLDNVLRVLYLIFSEGYLSSSDKTPIRMELCWEAMSLGKFLLDQYPSENHRIYALMSLMCFHASRLAARTASQDDILLFDEQDRDHWDDRLILQGEWYLQKSAYGEIVSKYHLEAAIAFWHTTDDPDRWEHVLQLYNKLLIMEYSPTLALNRTYALAKANSVEEAIREAKKLKLTDNHYYFWMLAELYRLHDDVEQEAFYLRKTLALTDRPHEVALIQRRLRPTE